MKKSFTSIPNRLNSIVYVEPNYHKSTAAYDSSGLNVFEQSPDLSDYGIFVNLEVEVVGRTIRSEKNHYVVSWQSKAGSQESTVNFMEGSKIPLGDSGKYINALTTNYTDCFLRDLKRIGGNTEMFGISSIDIAYNNYMVPEVTIEFVDVRGAALFSPRESQDGNDGALSQEPYDTAGSFFQCFFTFPYPKFTLLVKGFYGQPVSYELTCSDFRARFDSQTGNFACTAKFVGYAFSFLSDVMVNAMVAAPYSDYIGSDYWDAQKFTLPGTNGGTKEMPKLAQLIEDAKTILANAEKEREDSSAYQSVKQSQSASSACSEILDAYREFSNELRARLDKGLVSIPTDLKHSDCQFFGEIDDNICCAILLTNNNMQGKPINQGVWSNSKLEDSYNALVEKINSFNEDYVDYHLPTPVNILNVTCIKSIYYEDLDAKKGSIGKHTPSYMEGRWTPNNADSKAWVNFSNSVNATKESRAYSGCTCAYFYTDYSLVDIASKIISEVNGMSDELAEIEQKALDEAVANQLGFWPSVENITRIIMAHFETFAKMIHKTGIEICTTEPKRTATSLGINGDELPDVIKDPTDNFVPPFPKVVKKVSYNGSITEEDAWVGDFSGDFREKDLVHGLLNGITAVATLLKNSSGDPYTNTSYGSNRTDTVNMPRPLTAYDFVGGNPYQRLSSDAFNSLENLLSLVALRGISVINDNSIFGNSTDFKAIGKLEAENILDGHSLGSNAKSELQGLIGNGHTEFMKNLLGTFVSESAGKKPWGENKKLFTENRGNLYLENTKVTHNGKNGVFLPISSGFTNGWSTINKIKGEKAYRTVNFITNIQPVKNEVPTKNLFSIDTDINRIKNIVDNYIKSVKDKLMSDVIFDGNVKDTYVKNAHVASELYKIPIIDEGFKVESGMNLFPSSGQDGVKPFEKEMPEFKRNHEFKDKNGHKLELDEYDEGELKETFDSPDLFEKIQVGSIGVFLDPKFYKYYDRTDGYKKYWQAFKFLQDIGVPKGVNDYIDDLVNGKKNIVYIPISKLIYIGALIRYNGSGNEDVIKLRYDYRIRLEELFNEWVNGGEKFNALIQNKKFPTYDELIKDLALTGVNRELTEKDFVGKTVGELKAKFGSNITRSYLTVYKAGGRALTLFCRGDSIAAKNLTFFLLKGCALINYSNLVLGDWSDGDDDNAHSFKVDKGKLNNFIEGVLTGLKDANNTTTETDDHINQAEVPPNATTDIKVAVYRYCKLLYDKWLGGLTEEKFVNDWTHNRFFDETSNSAQDQYFHFIDCYYNKVGQRVPINLGDLCEQIQNCWQQDQYSLLTLLSDMYAKNKMQFLCVQNFKSLTDGMETLFDPIPYLEMAEPKRHPNFIVVYPYESSSKLDMNGHEYVNDTFMINQPISSKNKWPEALKSRSLGVYSGYNVPAFGVSFGKMYQSYFTGFDVSMDNPTVTEQSIKAMFQIASQNNEGLEDEKRAGSETVGQDLFTIYSNNSYDCTVTMMGCPWIQPLMYFCLNNVPMFRGTYQIVNVTHRLEPGNMTTTFKGVRMANTSTRIVREIFLRNTTDRANSSDAPSLANLQANVDNDCEYKVYPIIYGSTDLSAFVNAPTSQSAEIQDALIVMNYFMANGFTKEAAAGICGNIAMESSWNINVVEETTKANKGYGLCQWTNSTRLNVLKTRCGKKPDLKCQLDYCIAEWNCENDMNHLPGGCGSKAILMAAKTPEQAAEVVCWKFEAPKEETAHLTERKNKARLYYDSYGATPIRTENNANEDTKVSDLARGFLDAINKTAQNSAIGGIVTIDERFTNRNVLYLRETKNGCDLSQIFDVIVNAYFDKVEKVYWVATQNTSKYTAAGIVVFVKEGVPSKTIQVMNPDLKTPLNVIEELPDNFYKTIAKRYHFRKNGSSCTYDKTFEREVPQFAGHSDVICNKADIKDCNEILSELGVGGAQGLLKTPMPIGSDGWDAAKAANFLIEHNVGTTSAHICAFAVQQAIRAGGAEPSTGSGYRMVVNAINSRKWEQVAHGTNLKKAQSNNIQGYVPQVGDIFGMVKGNERDAYGHVCMFCGGGNGWISDFIQRQPLVYNTSVEYWVARYVGGAVKGGIKPTGLCFNGTCLKGSL